VASSANVTTAIERIEALYRADGARMWRALVAYGGNRELASDAVAEAFAQALRRGEELHDPSSWTWVAAFRIAAGEMQREQRHAGIRAPDPTYEMPELLPHLFQALARVSPNQRLAVVLHDYADRPTSEIAGLMGITTGTVHVHLSEGRRRLRTLLETDDG
jgi:RNA polymerase sigma-70 factor, ECF subfamily